MEGKAERVKERCLEMTGGVVIAAELVVGVGLAVNDVAASLGEQAEEATRFVGKGMLVAIAGTVEPPDLSRGGGGRELMEHGEDGSGADTGAEEDDGSGAGAKSEGAARGAEVEPIAGLDVLVQKGTGDAVRFLLDADAVVGTAGGVREGVIAEERWQAFAGGDLHDDKLSG